MGSIHKTIVSDRNPFPLDCQANKKAIIIQAINKSRHRAFIVSKGKRKKYEQNPKIRSFQIKTNKIQESIGKGVGYTEGRY